MCDTQDGTQPYMIEKMLRTLASCCGCHQGEVMKGEKNVVELRRGSFQQTGDRSRDSELSNRGPPLKSGGPPEARGPCDKPRR